MDRIDCSECSRRKWYQIGYNDGLNDSNQVDRKNNNWIPCSSGLMPYNEEVVEITYKYKSFNSDKYTYSTTKAFYHDGTMTTEDSNFCWYDTYNWEFNEEKDAYIIPEGWWEYNYFGESYGIVDRQVIAWRFPSDPYKED